MVCIISRDSASWTGQVILQKKLPELHLSYLRKIITGNIRFVVLVFEDVIWYQKRCLISLIYLWMKQREKIKKMDQVADEIRGRFGYQSIQRAFMYQDKILAQLNAKEHTVHPQAYFHG